MSSWGPRRCGSGGARSWSCSTRASRGGASGLAAVGSTAEESWAWDDVAGEGLVDVEEDAGVSLSVDGCAKSTTWACGAASSDLEVDALRVVLGAIRGVGRVEGNYLVTENVVSWGDGRRNGDGPAVVFGDELIRGACARVGARDDTTLVDLEELESGLVDGFARTIAVGQVVNDRP